MPQKHEINQLNEFLSKTIFLSADQGRCNVLHANAVCIQRSRTSRKLILERSHET
jgi:hypothetical protein